MRTSESPAFGLLPGVAAAALLCVSCVEHPDTRLGDPVSLATTSDGAIAAELVARAAAGLMVGRNSLGLRATDEATGERVTAAAVSWSWQMSMAGSTHGCPHRDLPTAADDQGYFDGFVVLPMASSAGGAWSSTVTIRPETGGEHVLTFDELPVANSDRAQTLAGSDGTSYLVSFSLADGADPVAGDNAVVITAHAEEGPTDFRDVDDLTITLAADMPSMGHGSSATVTATSTGHGEYEGVVELSMPGAWAVTATLKRGGVTLGLATFEIDL